MPDQEMQHPATSVLAIWSLVLGILGLALLGPITGIPAVICGHMARSRIRKSNGELTGSGMALAGLITGYIGIAWVGVVVLLIAGLCVAGSCSAPFVYTLF